MEHNMRLFEEPFNLILQGKKIIEIRLNDEKRQKVKIGDHIIFWKLPNCEENLKVRVSGLLHYESFEKLYKDIPFDLFGRDGKSLEWMIKGTYKIYTKEQEKRYGALGCVCQVVFAEIGN